ncbi:MAG: xanthine dehydrogenase [Proteobacteria bacterium]|nr:xanthine dehydrogenase [Pseudomonadota bacterium]
MRNYIVFYINGKRITINDAQAFMPVANFLRSEKAMPGTKIVCAEGDCGACTLLKASPNINIPDAPPKFFSFNSCITPVFLLDCAHIITVEGLKTESCAPDPIQKAFVSCNASQCGYCTPGFVMAMAGLFEQCANPTKKAIQNHLTGNLCRCTGYDSIINAGLSVDGENRQTLFERYSDDSIWNDLKNHQTIPVQLEAQTHQGPKTFFAPQTLQEASKLRQTYKDVRLIAAATDLGVQINKRRTLPSRFLSLSLIPKLHQLEEINGHVLVGAQVNFERLRLFLKERMPDFARFLNLFASPQIKHVGTLVGNTANASPIADSTPYLMMSNASIVLWGKQGERKISILDFYLGYKKLNMEADELISKIEIPLPDKNAQIKLYKISARRDLDISCVNAAMQLSCSIIDGQPSVKHVSIAYGGVGPTVVRVPKTEAFLKGKPLSHSTFKKASQLLCQEITPISDVRGSQDFRLQVAQNLLKRFYIDLVSSNSNLEGSQ